MDTKTKDHPEWLKLENVSAKSGDLFLYNAIGPTDEAAPVLAKLRGLKVATLNVRINSPGGSVFGGLAVYNALAALDAKIVVHIDGLAASIASAIAMAGDEIVMAENAIMVIHNPSTSTEGDAKEHRAQADVIEKLGANLAAIYSARTGMTAEAAAEIMAAETWLTAAECLALGFATSITEAKQIAATFDLSGFKNVPASAVAAASAESAADRAVADKVFAAKNAVRAQFTSQIASQRAEIEDLKAKLAYAESMSAANLGVPPIANIATATPGGDPRSVLEKWKSLKGPARGAFYAAHQNEIWAGQIAQDSAGQK